MHEFKLIRWHITLDLCVFSISNASTYHQCVHKRWFASSRVNFCSKKGDAQRFEVVEIYIFFVERILSTTWYRIWAALPTDGPKATSSAHQDDLGYEYLWPLQKSETSLADAPWRGDGGASRACSPISTYTSRHSYRTVAGDPRQIVSWPRTPQL